MIGRHVALIIFCLYFFCNYVTFALLVENSNSKNKSSFFENNKNEIGI